MIVKRILAVLASLTLFVGVLAAPASAHTTYCGHTSSTHWGFDPHKVFFVRHWWEPGGRHYHTVNTTWFWGAYGSQSFHRCH